VNERRERVVIQPHFENAKAMQLGCAAVKHSRQMVIHLQAGRVAMTTLPFSAPWDTV